ncbi:MAG: hypothetical protein R3C13_01265 [Hyphomonas sp.]|uniref:hypothetical protein n=1 Tax=Hyphomonas sp. TaxID=87 RepID=UPI0035282929
MSDIVVTVSLTSAEEVALLATVVDAFIGQALGRGKQLAEAPDVMVQTAFTPNGDVSKKLIFQDRGWADAFLDLWEHEKLQAAEA